jgi:hypothetical protein
MFAQEKGVASFRALAILLRGLLIAALLAAGPVPAPGQVDADAACAVSKLGSCAVSAGTREHAGETVLLADRKSDLTDAPIWTTAASSVASFSRVLTVPRNATLPASGHHCSHANPPTGPPSHG